MMPVAFVSFVDVSLMDLGAVAIRDVSVMRSHTTLPQPHHPRASCADTCQAPRRTVRSNSYERAEKSFVLTETEMAPTVTPPFTFTFIGAAVTSG
jgi:hypothetical protein